MRKLLFLAALLSIAAADKWALFVSGNHGWHNYCISSTICRGYDLLQDAGIAEDHIVYMGFNDVWDSPTNPFPGQIFTDTSDGPGHDHAAQCKPHIDYPDKMVSAELFMATLRGDKEEAKKLTGVENPKVIESTAEDTVFVYYMDHGAIGFCEVGKSDLKEDVLIDTINTMFANKQYKEMVFYFEACHSGSMFRKLEKGKNVYAFTGSDTEHSAWMCNCPPNDVVDGKSMGTCLSAYYDNYWMHEITVNGADITNNDMFKMVHEKTALKTDQNVSQFGDIETIGETPLKEYIGDYKPTYSNKDTTCTEGVMYEDVPVHLAKWSAIRAQGNDKMAELQDAVYEDALKEVVVMRAAREYFKNDKKADDAKLARPASYDFECVKELGLKLVAKCGYKLPMRESHVTVLENICANGNVEIDFSSVC